MILRVYQCRCRSVWCKKCAKTSPTNDRIRERLTEMDWKRVRHVVLTVKRSIHPAAAYDYIRTYKLIPQLIRDLDLTGQKWIWVLEFHRGGFPHWHLLVESDRGMIGKARIAEMWTLGLVWESYVKSDAHWGAIVGYHQSKGYLAGESKAHQLELPEWAMGRSRVRKFGGHVRNVPRGTIENDSPEKVLPQKDRRADVTYRDRFLECGNGSRISCSGQWAETPTDYVEAVRIAGSRLQTRGKGAFEGDSPAVIRTANRILSGE